MSPPSLPPATKSHSRHKPPQPLSCTHSHAKPSHIGEQKSPSPAQRAAPRTTTDSAPANERASTRAKSAKENNNHQHDTESHHHIVIIAGKPNHPKPIHWKPPSWMFFFVCSVRPLSVTQPTEHANHHQHHAQLGPPSSLPPIRHHINDMMAMIVASVVAPTASPHRHNRQPAPPPPPSPSSPQTPHVAVVDDVAHRQNTHRLIHIMRNQCETGNVSLEILDLAT